MNNREEKLIDKFITYVDRMSKPPKESRPTGLTLDWKTAKVLVNWAKYCKRVSMR